MAQNLFQTEDMKKYIIRNGSTSNYGEWVDRNGVPAMRIGPLPYYVSPDYSRILLNEMEPGKRYVFDFWMDVDDVISGGKNVPAGINIQYQDGTRKEFTASAQSTSGNSGWQHIKYITTEGKNLSGFTIYYYTSTPGYYRWDSSITEYETTSITKTGALRDGCTKEGYDTASIVNGGNVYTDSIIEN